MRRVLPAQRSLVENGAMRFGTFDGPFENVNALDAYLGVPLPRALKNSRLKEWQAFQFGNEDVFVNVALFNAKMLALVQVKVYDRRTKERLLFERKLFPWELPIPDNVLDSECSYQSRDCTMSFHNRLKSDELEIHFDVGSGTGHPRMLGNIVADTRGQQPQVVSLPFGRRHGMYSHKALAPISGHLLLGDREIRFDHETSYLLMDDHKGYYPFAMQWDWIAAGGFDRDGTLLGVNLTRNQARDPERYNENCLWLAGERHLLPAIQIEHRDTRIWYVRDQQGRVDLRFDIETDSRLDINALVLRSNYRGPFGKLSGTIRPEDGPRVEIQELFGMGEEFYLRC